ncbi:MAG: hypothetical protein E6I46_02450 [Chloroflexi bacterium]|nr:MAG: hypothetical protein E6I46_02450 [Chloroflexota bacterium]
MASVDPSRQIAGLADRTTALVGWTIAWRATSAIATLALGALLIRQLPADEYGRYTFVLSVLVYIALLATFGQDQGLLRYLPEVLTRGDRAAANDLLRKSAIAILAVWLLTSGAVWVSRPAIDSLLHAHVADLLALGTFLLLGGIAAGVLSFALVAIYDMRSQAIATPIAGALTLALAVVFLHFGQGLGGVLVAGAVGQSCLAAFYLAILLRRVRRAEGVRGATIADLCQRLAAEPVDRVGRGPAVREYFSFAICWLDGGRLLRHGVRYSATARRPDSQFADRRLGGGHAGGLAPRVRTGPRVGDGLL